MLHDLGAYDEIKGFVLVGGIERVAGMNQVSVVPDVKLLFHHCQGIPGLSEAFHVPVHAVHHGPPG